MSSRQVSRIGRPTMSRPDRAGRPRSFWPRPTRPRRSWLKILLVVGIVFGLWRYFAIDKVEVRGVETLNQQAIELAVRKGIARQLLGGNLVTLSASRLRQSVTTEIPEVKDLAVRRQWPDSLIVTVGEREPSLAWQSGGELYLLDRDGTVIRQISGKAGRLAVVRDTKNLPVRLGTRIVPERFVAFTLATTDGLRNIGGGIKAMTVTDTTSELHVRLADGYLVKFDTMRGAERQIKNLRLVLGELAKQNRRPAEYVDLRVDGKAYYK